MKRAALIAALGLIILATGVAIGRATAPTKVVEKTVTVERRVEVAAQTKEDASVETKTANVRNDTHWRIRYVARPDGSVVATASSDSGQSSAAATYREEAKRETEVRYVDREKLIEKIVVKEAARPSWSVGIGAGVRSGPSPVYQGNIGRRLIGPFWLGIYVTTAKEIGAQLRMEF